MGSSDIDSREPATDRSQTGMRAPPSGNDDLLAGISFEPAYSIIDRLRHIHEAPLKNLRRTLWWMRKTFFTKPRSVTPAYLVEFTKPEVVSLFGRNHFEPGWELSYHYRGEVLNLRRVEYVDDGPYDWWQVHIRGYSHDDGGIELTAHYETEPSEHPDAHINLHGIDIEHGMAAIRGILDEEGIDFITLEPSGSTSDAATHDAPSTVTVE